VARKEEDEGPDRKEVAKYLKEGERICKDLKGYDKNLEKLIATAEELEKLAAKESEQPSV
jgi:hypothetical protein